LISRATPTNTLYTLSLHDALPIFTMQCRQGRYPDVEFIKIRSHGNTSVLRQAFFADIESGTYFNFVDDHRVFINRDKIRTGLDIDRKSTRLNSSHVKISYAVFCLK